MRERLDLSPKPVLTIPTASDFFIGRGERLHHIKTGVALVVLNLDYKILAIEENITKEETGRTKDQIGIPMETQKMLGHGQIEPLELTAWAALGEGFSGIDPKSLWRVNGSLNPVFYPTASVRVVCRPQIYFYNGSDHDFASAVNDETTPLGFFPLEELLAQENIRPLAKKVMGDLIDRGDLKRAIWLFNNVPQSRQLVLPPDFSIREHCEQRERFPDV